MTIDGQEGSATQLSGDIRQEAARGGNIPAAGASCKVGSSDEEGVDDEVAHCLWLPLLGKEKSSVKELGQQQGFCPGAGTAFRG